VYLLKGELIGLSGVRAGDSRSVVVRFADVRRVQRQRRALLDGVTAAPVLHQLGPLHRRHRPVQLRPTHDAPTSGDDAGRRLDGVRLSLAHTDTPRPLHDRLAARQARRRLQRVLLQGWSARPRYRVSHKKMTANTLRR